MQSNFYDTAFKFRNYFDTTLNAYFFMKELIDRIMANAQITGPQAEKALETVKDFVKEKFPMMAGAVDILFDQAAKKEDDFME